MTTGQTIVTWQPYSEPALAYMQFARELDGLLLGGRGLMAKKIEFSARKDPLLRRAPRRLEPTPAATDRARSTDGQSATRPLGARPRRARGRRRRAARHRAAVEGPAGVVAVAPTRRDAVRAQAARAGAAGDLA